MVATARSTRTALAVALGLTAACGLDFDRYDPATARADGGTDAATDAGLDAAPAEAAGGPDAPAESASSACSPTPGTLVAPEPPGTITIDGDLSDWGNPSYTLLAANDAALILGPNGTCMASNATSQCMVPDGETAELALLHDSSNLYVGVHVTVPNVGGTSTTSPYLNDAVEIYLRGDAAPTGDYTSDDHQYVIDWQNLVLDYGPSNGGAGQTNPPGVTSAVKMVAGGYVVEVKVAVSELGQTALSSGQMLGFDFGVDHGNGTTAARSLLVWWMATHATPTCTTPKCTGCNPDQPYCDTLDFGLVCAD